MINIKIDSRKVTKGDTFVALRGHTVDGHDYIAKAIDNGAVKIVVDHKVDYNIPMEIVEDTSKWLTDYIVDNYAEELNELNILGITGTNGKTTSAYLTYQILNKLGSKTAYIGTIGFFLPEEDVVELPNTTPNILDLYELILTAKEKNCKNIVMEVSSHALDEERIKGINFTTAAFTNLTQDHLDYHKTMDNYLNAKLLILNLLKGQMIINKDDSYADKWLDKYNNCITFGYNSDDYKIINYENNHDGMIITFNYQNKNYSVQTNLTSEFNVYNYLTALGLVNSLGFTVEDIINVTKYIYPPKGRCEQIKVKNGFAVIDYAHTPDAVDKIIAAFNKDKKGRIITIVGCGGDRDPKKRPIMGKIASDNSDYVIFTNDNPRTEDPNIIMNNILEGVNKDNYTVELDRHEAIIKALDMINENDIVLILGKGHENYQIFGHDKVHFDDAEEVNNYNKNISK